MDHEERETVGAISLELQQKDPETRDPIEIEREVHKEYEKSLMECLDEHKKIFDGDFYLVVLTKKERLMHNVLRHYFLGRQSCPTPDHDQTVYKYSRSDDFLEFLWTIPDKDTCHLLRDNALQVAPEERALRDFAVEFFDGTLLKKAKLLNREVEDSNMLQKSDKIVIAKD